MVLPTTTHAVWTDYPLAAPPSWRQNLNSSPIKRQSHPESHMYHSTNQTLDGNNKFDLLLTIDKSTFFKLVAQAASIEMHLEDYINEALKALSEDDDDFKRFYTIGENPTETTNTTAF